MSPGATSRISEPPEWLAKKRQTGRTTRMLETVKEACVPGARIVVVLPNAQMIPIVRRRFEQLIPHTADKSCRNFVRGETYWNGGTVHWVSPDKRGDDWVWSWDMLRFVNLPDSWIHFIDPACIEIRFHRELDAWHRFDADPA